MNDYREAYRYYQERRSEPDTFKLYYFPVYGTQQYTYGTGTYYSYITGYSRVYSSRQSGGSYTYTGSSNVTPDGYYLGTQYYTYTARERITDIIIIYQVIALLMDLLKDMVPHTSMFKQVSIHLIMPIHIVIITLSIDKDIIQSMSMLVHMDINIKNLVIIINTIYEVIHINTL